MDSLTGIINPALPTTVGSGPQYKEYLRTQFIYKDFKDLNLQAFPASVRITSLLLVLTRISFKQPFGLLIVVYLSETYWQAKVLALPVQFRWRSWMHVWSPVLHLRSLYSRYSREWCKIFSLTICPLTLLLFFSRKSWKTWPWRLERVYSII